MSDFRMRELRALLGTTMESVLRRAMFEIMKIVENSLHDHQLELTQKGEEIVQLKVKLQRVELRLRDALITNDPAAQMGPQLGQMQPESEDVPIATTSTLLPETDFEIPEDWCAPVGYEVTTNQDYSLCPSVRLRQLSIPLYPIPLKKQEEIQQSIYSHQRTDGLRRSKRGSLQGGNQKPDQNPTATNRNGQPKQLRCDMARLLKENADKLGHTEFRSRRTNSIRNQQEETPTKGEVGESAAATSEPAEQQTEENEDTTTHLCRFCGASFESRFGRDVHERFHKWCRGCKRFLPSLGSLRKHKLQCQKFKTLMAKKARSKATSEPLSQATENQTSPKKEMGPANIKTGIQNHGVKKKYSCWICNKVFVNRSKQKEHMHVHTPGKPYFCGLCPKRFSVKQSLKSHMLKVHKDMVITGPTKEELTWTESLDVNQKKLSKRKAFGFKGKRIGWRECGTEVHGGFECNVCSRVSKSKSGLVEHHRVHTGEKPYECPSCRRRFRYQGQFSVHYKKCIKEPCDEDKSDPPTESLISSNGGEQVSLLQDVSETA